MSWRQARVQSAALDAYASTAFAAAQAQCCELLQSDFVRQGLTASDQQEADKVTADHLKNMDSMKLFEKGLHKFREKTRADPDAVAEPAPASSSAAAGRGKGRGKNPRRGKGRPKKVKVDAPVAGGRAGPPRRIPIDDVNLDGALAPFPSEARLWQDDYNNRFMVLFKGMKQSRSWPLHGTKGAAVQLLIFAWKQAQRFGEECPLDLDSLTPASV